MRPVSPRQPGDRHAEIHADRSFVRIHPPSYRWLAVGRGDGDGCRRAGVEVVEADPEDGDEFVRRAFTDVKGLYVTYTEHPLADGRVQPFHESNMTSASPGETS